MPIPGNAGGASNNKATDVLLPPLLLTSGACSLAWVVLSLLCGWAKSCGVVDLEPVRLVVVGLVGAMVV